MEGATDGRRRTNVVNCCDGDGAEMFSAAATANPRNIPLGSDCLHFPRWLGQGNRTTQAVLHPQHHCSLNLLLVLSIRKWCPLNLLT